MAMMKNGHEESMVFYWQGSNVFDNDRKFEIRDSAPRIKFYASISRPLISTFGSSKTVILSYFDTVT